MVLDSLISAISPTWAAKREHARMLEASYKRARAYYDAAQSSQYHRSVRHSGTADQVMNHATYKVRDWTRYLDENSDLAIGILDALVNGIVGSGIEIEPLVIRANGEPHTRVNATLRDLLDLWKRRPEITGEISFTEMQRLTCRTWMRDGECLARHIMAGNVRHFSAVPYSVQLIEPDYLPFSLIEKGPPRVVHGVEMESTGRPSAYYLYPQGEANVYYSGAVTVGDTQRVPADLIEHIKFTRRIGQTRGVSVLHGVITRLDHVLDTEESELIAARVGAALTAAITKNPDMAYAGISGENTEDDAAGAPVRSMEFKPGMILDDLLPGEGIEMIGATRPNEKLPDFLMYQTRRAAAGAGTSYSTISRDYNGSYSSQRQELVESRIGYDRMRNYFIERFMRPIYERFVFAAEQRGLVRFPRNVDRYRVEFVAPSLPWIDPQKEMNAHETAVENRFKSRRMVIRELGYDPARVDTDIAQDTEPDNQAESTDRNETESQTTNVREIA